MSDIASFALKLEGFDESSRGHEDVIEATDDAGFVFQLLVNQIIKKKKTCAHVNDKVHSDDKRSEW